MEWHLDGEQVADYMEDWFYDDMNDSPEDYLDDDDRELSKEGEAMIDAIDEDLGDLYEELEEAEDWEEEEIQDRITELEERKEEISEDEDNWEYTQEAKDRYVESRMDDVRDDPMEALRHWGMEDRVADFIDEEGFIEDVISTDGLSLIHI